MAELAEVSLGNGNYCSTQILAGGIVDTILREALNLSHPRIAEIISGKRCISIEESVMLTALFETDSDFWINVQASHVRWEARQIMAAKTDLKSIKALLASQKTGNLNSANTPLNACSRSL